MPHSETTATETKPKRVLFGKKKASSDTSLPVETAAAPAPAVEPTPEPAPAQPIFGIFGFFKPAAAKPIEAPAEAPAAASETAQPAPATKKPLGLFTKKPAPPIEPAAEQTATATEEGAVLAPVANKKLRFGIKSNKARAPVEPDPVPATAPAVEPEAPAAAEPGFFDGMIKASTSSVTGFFAIFSPRPAAEAPAAEPPAAEDEVVAAEIHKAGCKPTRSAAKPKPSAESNNPPTTAASSAA